MAGFFLSHKNAEATREKVIDTFKVTGVNAYRIYDLNSWELILFEKTKPLSANYFEDDRKRTTFICGTLIYKNYSLEESLKKLHFDYYNNKIDYNDLLGNFCIIFWNGKNFKIFRDKLKVQHVFQREDGLCISSSFLAILKSANKKFKINQLALQEKLATGFVIGEDTLVTGIKKVNDTLPFRVLNNDVETISQEKLNIHFEPHNQGKNKSIEAQIKNLTNYFQSINKAFQSHQGDLGLSSGFDCRLILALTKNELSTPLHIHSHNTVGVHDTEIFYAKQLVEKMGIELELIPTQSLEKSEDENIENILNQNLYFFDGRSGRHLGAYSETYTPGYRLKSMGNADYSLNGLGGELFRDSYFMGNRLMKWEEWANRFLFYPLSSEAIGTEKQLKELSYVLKQKIEKHLETDFSKADLYKTHAYYGLLKMPQANGTVAQAYGKVSHFLFPFIEYRIIEEALKGVPYLGIGGTYQAELITKLSRELASIGSHYGIRFDKPSLKYLIWSKIKSMGTTQTRNNLVRKNLLNRVQGGKHQLLLKKIDEVPALRYAKEALLTHSAKTNFELLLLDNTQRRYVIYLGHMLNKLSPYIE